MVGIECDVATFYRHFKKARKVTMVGIECNGATSLTTFQEGPNQKLFFQVFFQYSASKMANCIIVVKCQLS